jgi:branched-chain amino acid transport system ATP-binding protein
VIEVRDVRAGYVPGVDIIQGLSATFPEGEISSIIGPNGAGKSTLLKTIFGFLFPHEGSVTYDGTDITRIQPSDMIETVGFSYIPQERSVFPDLTVRENLELGAWTFRKDGDRVETAIETVYDEFPALSDKRHDRAGTMSGGQQRMLEIGRSLIPDPDVVLVDEPSAGLAPDLASDVYRSIRGLRENDITVLLVDQNVEAAVDCGDELFILDQSTVRSQARTDEMDSDIDDIVSEWISMEGFA